MRILHVGKFHAPERGGIERYTEALAGYCTAQGDAVGALVHQRPGVWRTTREIIDGVEVRRTGCLAAPLYTPLSPTFPWELARALRDSRPDLLHLHFPNPSAFAALANPAARRLPWIIHWHADVPPDGPDWRLRVAYRVYRPFEQATLARAAAIVVTSQPYLDASAALVRWHDKTTVIPLGVAPAPMAKPGTDLWPVQSGMRLLAVGRLSYYKGFDVLIDSLAQVPDASLLLIGHGEREAELRARASSLGLGDRVRFAGDVDDDALASAYAGADVFVLPSLDRSEAFGLVLLEAMRASLPVIASAITGSGVGSVVQDGRTGLLVQPDDAHALAMAIDRLRDPEFRMRLGRAGRVRWVGEFTLEKSADAVRAIYRRVLEERPAPAAKRTPAA